MRDYFDVEQYIKKLEQSENIHDFESVPVPDIAENQNYIFISYSHKDYKKVYADLAYLYREGVRFWYDRGLSAGKNWDAEVKERLESPRCSGVIFYLSENMFLSKSVNEEISLVCGMEHQSRKNYFCVNLSEGQPKDILRNIMRMEDDVLEHAGLDMDRIGVLAKAFSDKQTYLQQTGIDYYTHLLDQIKEQFDVIEIQILRSGVLVGKEDNEKIPFTRHCIIGRDPAYCNYLINTDNAVSRQHACISIQKNGCVIADMGSSNGTFLNGRKLEVMQYVPLKYGDVVRIGKKIFVFRKE